MSCFVSLWVLHTATVKRSVPATSLWRECCRGLWGSFCVGLAAASTSWRTPGVQADRTWPEDADFRPTLWVIPTSWKSLPSHSSSRGKAGSDMNRLLVSGWKDVLPPNSAFSQLQIQRYRAGIRGCAQSDLTLCDLMDCSPPGSSVHGIFQVRILKWIAISFSRSSQPRDWTCVSWGSCIGSQILYLCATREAPEQWKCCQWQPTPGLHGRRGLVGCNPQRVGHDWECVHAYTHTHTHTHTHALYILKKRKRIKPECEISV